MTQLQSIAKYFVQAFLHLLILSFFFLSVEGMVTVTLPNKAISTSGGIVYYTKLAPFGIPLKSNIPYDTDLMLPSVQEGELTPSNNYLCKDDEFWRDFFLQDIGANTTRTNDNVRQRLIPQNTLWDSRSNAILVPKGRCPLHEKINLILKINEHIIFNNNLQQQNKDKQKLDLRLNQNKNKMNEKRITDESDENNPPIKFVILYDNTTTLESTLDTEMEETSERLKINQTSFNSNSTNPDMHDEAQYFAGINLSVLVMNYNDGNNLNEILNSYHWDQVRRNFRKDNFKQSIGSIGRPVRLEFLNLYDPPSDSNHRTEWGLGDITSSWLRFVVCILLFLFPLIRAFLLWYNAGGRIRIRAEENGSGQIGIYYVRPHPNWMSGFHPGDMDDNRILASASTEQQTRVTKEEVMALPEVSYNSDQIKTSCCSICLDEFQQGEMVRMLPCNHAYHTNCILPWLTERQSCCPLCKVSIKTNEEESEGGISTDSSSEENINDSNVP